MSRGDLTKKKWIYLDENADVGRQKVINLMIWMMVKI